MEKITEFDKTIDRMLEMMQSPGSLTDDDYLELYSLLQNVPQYPFVDLLIGMEQYIDTINAGGAKMSGEDFKLFFVIASHALTRIPSDMLVYTQPPVHDMETVLEDIKYVFEERTTTVSALGNVDTANLVAVGNQENSELILRVLSFSAKFLRYICNNA